MKRRTWYKKGGEESVQQGLRDAVAVGGEAFRNKMKRLAGGGSRETSGKRELRQRVPFEEALRAVEHLKGETRAQFLNRRGDWGTPLTMWLGRRYCGMTLREIGAAVGGKDYAAVSDRLRRFERALVVGKALRRHRDAAVRILNLETCPYATNMRQLINVLLNIPMFWYLAARNFVSIHQCNALGK